MKSGETAVTSVLGGRGASLMPHYRVIGNELLRLEIEMMGFRRNLPAAYDAFRQHVVFVPTEVLESYLDDLLDLTVEDSKLFINRERSRIREVWIPCGGLLAAIACGLYPASLGASVWWSFLLSSVLALPFAILLSSLPQGGAARRMSFAQIVSHEVLRRRGASGEQATLRLNRRRFYWDRIVLEGGSTRVGCL